jgi:hypothetical protein
LLFSGNVSTGAADRGEYRQAAGVVAAINQDAFNETPWRLFDAPLDSGLYATGQTNQLTVQIGPRALTISDKDLSGEYKSGG